MGQALLIASMEGRTWGSSHGAPECYAEGGEGGGRLVLKRCEGGTLQTASVSNTSWIYGHCTPLARSAITRGMPQLYPGTLQYFAFLATKRWGVHPKHGRLIGGEYNLCMGTSVSFPKALTMLRRNMSGVHIKACCTGSGAAIPKTGRGAT